MKSVLQLLQRKGPMPNIGDKAETFILNIGDKLDVGINDTSMYYIITKVTNTRATGQYYSSRIKGNEYTFVLEGWSNCRFVSANNEI